MSDALIGCIIGIGIGVFVLIYTSTYPSDKNNLNKRLTTIETVLIIKGIMPKELATKNNELAWIQVK